MSDIEVTGERCSVPGGERLALLSLFRFVHENEGKHAVRWFGIDGA